eukprot:6486541-Amphidinium_carterae.2
MLAGQVDSCHERFSSGMRYVSPAGGVLAGGAASITVGTLNVTSIYSAAPALRDLPLSLLAIQETKLCLGNTGTLNMLRARWDVYLPDLPAGDGDRRTRSGGVMLLCERQWQVDLLALDGLRAARHNVLLFGLHHKPSQIWLSSSWGSILRTA